MELASFLHQVREQRGAALLAVLNVTPDSFHDGGLYCDPGRARERADELLAQGADILDIGAESTRPGAPAIPAAEQWRRAGDLIRHVAKLGAKVSVDTCSAWVAERALDAGAVLVNDVSCLADPQLASVTAKYGADLLLMHSRGMMSTMGGFSVCPDQAYADVVEEVRSEWLAKRELAKRQGLSPERVFFDPGLGFHKSAAHSWELVRRFGEFRGLSSVLVLGSSRKSFIGKLDDSSHDERLPGTLVSGLAAVERGAHLLRVHDVAAHRQALLAWKQLQGHLGDGSESLALSCPTGESPLSKPARLNSSQPGGSGARPAPDEREERRPHV